MVENRIKMSSFFNGEVQRSKGYESSGKKKKERKIKKLIHLHRGRSWTSLLVIVCCLLIVY